MVVGAGGCDGACVGCEDCSYDGSLYWFCEAWTADEAVVCCVVVVEVGWDEDDTEFWDGIE